MNYNFLFYNIISKFIVEQTSKLNRTMLLNKTPYKRKINSPFAVEHRQTREITIKIPKVYTPLLFPFIKTIVID